MRLSFFQILFLLVMFYLIFHVNNSSARNITNLLNSFWQNIKKHNSIRK